MDAVAFPPAQLLGSILCQGFLHPSVLIFTVLDDDFGAHDVGGGFEGGDDGQDAPNLTENARKMRAQRFQDYFNDMFEFDGENPFATEYVYFDNSKLNQWAGPQHWKPMRPKPAFTKRQGVYSIRQLEFHTNLS